MFIKLSLFLQMGALIMTAGADDLCPEQCSCRPDAITCEGMTSFPAYIPKMAKTVYLFKMDITEIPPGSFENLTNIKHIEIYQSKIQRIRSCAFSNLKNMNTLSIHEAEIGEIESYAFSSLTNLESLSLFSTTVDFIHPLAFVDIHKVRNWDFNFLEVNIMDSYAISRISQVSFMNIFTSIFREFRSNAIFGISLIDSFQFLKNSFDILQCRTIEDISKAVPSFAFYDNKLECTCALSWILPHSNNVDSYLSWSLQYNTCQGPEALILDTGKGKAIADLKNGDLICVNETKLNGCPDLSPPSLEVSSCSWMAPQSPTEMTPEAASGGTSEFSTETTSEASTEMSRKPSSKKHESSTTGTSGQPISSTGLKKTSLVETTSDPLTAIPVSSYLAPIDLTPVSPTHSTSVVPVSEDVFHPVGSTITDAHNGQEITHSTADNSESSTTTQLKATNMEKTTSEQRDTAKLHTIHPDILHTTYLSDTSSILLETIKSGHVASETSNAGNSSKSYHSTSTSGIPTSTEKEHVPMSSGIGRVTSTVKSPSSGLRLTTINRPSHEGRSTPGLTARATRVNDVTSAPPSDDSSKQSYIPNNQANDQSLEIGSPQKVPSERERGDNPESNEIDKNNSSSNVNQAVVFWLVLLSFISVLVSK